MQKKKESVGKYAKEKKHVEIKIKLESELNIKHIGKRKIKGLKLQSFFFKKKEEQK